MLELNRNRFPQSFIVNRERQSPNRNHVPIQIALWRTGIPRIWPLHNNKSSRLEWAKAAFNVFCSNTRRRRRIPRRRNSLLYSRLRWTMWWRWWPASAAWLNESIAAVRVLVLIKIGMRPRARTSSVFKLTSQARPAARGLWPRWKTTHKM